MENINTIKKNEDGSYVAEIVTDRILSEEEVQQAKDKYENLLEEYDELVNKQTEELTYLELEIVKYDVFGSEVKEEVEEILEKPVY